VKGDAVPGWVTKDDYTARCEFFRKIGAKRQSLIDAWDTAIPGSAERQELAARLDEFNKCIKGAVGILDAGGRLETAYVTARLTGCFTL